MKICKGTHKGTTSFSDVQFGDVFQYASNTYMRVNACGTGMNAVNLEAATLVHFGRDTEVLLRPRATLMLGTD